MPLAVILFLFFLETLFSQRYLVRKIQSQCHGCKFWINCSSVKKKKKRARERKVFVLIDIWVFIFLSLCRRRFLFHLSINHWHEMNWKISNLSVSLQDLRLWRPSVRSWRCEVRTDENCCSQQMSRKLSWQQRSFLSQVNISYLNINVVDITL